jgi:hypothetical protein
MGDKLIHFNRKTLKGIDYVEETGVNERVILRSF